jgi:outer membrane protein OmpA-like peptidoglycan-associated protein
MRHGLLLCGLALLALGGPALAQQPSADEIKAALTPKPLTRSLSRQNVTEAKPPSINLRVTFAYESAVILPEAESLLGNLASALKDPRFATTQFEIGGHTDARGSDEYNLALSARRAEAVRSYLIDRARIAASQLSAVGYGKSRLADPDHPEDAVNRRVEVVNLSAASAAK